MKIRRHSMRILTVALCMGMSTGAFAEPFNERGIVIIETTPAGSPGLGTTSVLLVRGFNDRGMGSIPDARVSSRQPSPVTPAGGFNDRGSYFASNSSQYPAGSSGSRIVDAR